MALHHVFGCKNPDCWNRIWLLDETLQRTFQDQELQPSDDVYVALVCNRCKQVRIYSASPKSSYHDPTYSAVDADPLDTMAPSGPLKCAVESCGFQVQSFATMKLSIETEAKRKELQTWIWDYLKCPEGHSIPNPRKT